MDAQQDRLIHERIERLERTVAQLQEALDRLNEALTHRGLEVPPEARTAAKPGEPASVQGEKAGEPRRSPDSPQQAGPSRPAHAPSRIFSVFGGLNNESWLNKIGIGLILFAVVFLFKYSIDQGWLTPSVRVGFGLALGIVLLGIAARTHAERRSFSQVLSGGGIAVFYITGFAAFQFYALVSHPAAFAFMCGVTLLAFVLSLRQNEAVLSVVAALGGLGTPFLLYTGTGGLPGLVWYTCLVLAGTAAVVFVRGWRSPLWVSVVGGWSIFQIGVEGVFGYAPEAASGRLALQLGIAFGCLVFWALPVLREVLRERDPSRWALPPVPALPDLLFSAAERHVHLLSISTPLIALAMSRALWSIPSDTMGWIVLCGAAVCGLAAWGLKRGTACFRLAYTHALVALVLLTLAVGLLLGGDVRFFAFAAEAAALHLLSHRLSDRGTAVGAHLLFFGVFVWLVVHLCHAVRGAAIFNARALTDFAVIAAGAGVSGCLFTGRERLVYRLVAHLAFLAWVWRELSPLDNGMGYITVVWGLYAVLLLVLGLRLNFPLLRTVAMGTILLVVGKLFLIDLAKLEAIWRILVFMGFGGLFLLLSYSYRTLWKPADGSGDQADG